MKKFLTKMMIFAFVFTLAVTNIVFATTADSSVSDITTSGGKILNAIMWFGYAIALIMVVVVGIRYILGSADAKASMKKAVVAWLIGAFIVFMATTIVRWVVTTVGLEDTAESIINAGMDVGK